MSNSAINTQVAQLKIGNVQNQADSTSIYSNGQWSFKNSTALTSVTITDAGAVTLGPSGFTGNHVVNGNVGIGVSTPNSRLHVYSTGNVPLTISSTQTTSYLQIDSSAGASGIASNGNALVFYTSNIGTERMRIEASGYIVVGRANSTVPGTSDGWFCGPLGDMTAVLSTSGNINTYHVYNRSSSSFRFFVSRDGQINATSTSIAGLSDASLKENVRDIETGLSQVLALKPRRFDWKEETQIDQKNVAGFIAQEVEEVLPELVYEYKYNETETKKSLKMGDMLPTLVKAIQELSAKVDAQAAEIEALKAKP